MIKVINCIIGVVETGDPSTQPARFHFPRVTIGPVPVHRIISSSRGILVFISPTSQNVAKCDVLKDANTQYFAIYTAEP